MALETQPPATTALGRRGTPHTRIGTMRPAGLACVGPARPAASPGLGHLRDQQRHDEEQQRTDHFETRCLKPMKGAIAGGRTGSLLRTPALNDLAEHTHALPSSMQPSRTHPLSKITHTRHAHMRTHARAPTHTRFTRDVHHLNISWPDRLQMPFFVGNLAMQSIRCLPRSLFLMFSDTLA